MDLLLPVASGAYVHMQRATLELTTGTRVYKLTTISINLRMMKLTTAYDKAGSAVLSITLYCTLMTKNAYINKFCVRKSSR